MTEIFHGILEVDKIRGVIYFHKDNITLLRICGLSFLPNMAENNPLDITIRDSGIIEKGKAMKYVTWNTT